MLEMSVYFGCVVSEPVVGLSEVIENNLVTIVALGRENDRRTRVGL
jgi:hypothetical protein